MATTTECPRCRRSTAVFPYLRGLYRFDLERARRLVGDGREPVEVDEDSLRSALEDGDLDPEHVAHVDPGRPGVIAYVQRRAEDGELSTGHVLIDGHHRAARCLRERRSFTAYLLTMEESLSFRTRALEAAPTPSPANGSAGDDPAEDTSAYERRFAASGRLYQRALQVIAGATTHDRRGFGPFPVYVERAEGPWKWDIQNRRLIDYWSGHGALLLGHGFGPVVEAVARQAARGTHFGACHEAEVRWAELVCRLVPSAQRVRFTSSGTEATLLALRAARAFTGRDRIVKFHGHFHGWHDEAMAHFFPAHEAGFSRGSLAGVTVIDAEESAVLAELGRGDVAAVILEPGGGSAGGLPSSGDWLRFLRDATQAHDSLLIFDEVISGFRQSPGGVQQETGVLPDLTTLAKILCGGLPGGAVAGRADVMAVFGGGTQRDRRRARVPHTGTFNSNPLSAAAGVTMLEHIADGAAQQKARDAAARLARLVNEAAEEHRVDVRLFTNGGSIYHILIGAVAAGQPLGPSPATAALYAAFPGRYARLRRALLVQGVDTHHVHGWVSAVHERDVIDATVEAFDRAFRRLRGAEGFGRSAAARSVSDASKKRRGRVGPRNASAKRR
jgi:glutamate-1-semialdehyde 2,1-aminomutase